MILSFAFLALPTAIFSSNLVECYQEEREERQVERRASVIDEEAILLKELNAKLENILAQIKQLQSVEK